MRHWGRQGSGSRCSHRRDAARGAGVGGGFSGTPCRARGAPTGIRSSKKPVKAPMRGSDRKQRRRYPPVRALAAAAMLMPTWWAI